MTALTVTGKEPQLKGHIGYALNLGWTKEELGEMFMHLVFYAGLPSTLNALSVARTVFEERGLMTTVPVRRKLGSRRGAHCQGERGAGGGYVRQSGGASGRSTVWLSGMEEWVTASLFGDVWGRPGLEKKVRSIATMSALCVLGRLPQLKATCIGH